MGNEEIQSEATVLAPSVDSYKVIHFSGPLLPDAYRNMVLSKWMRSLRYGNEFFKTIDSKEYFFHYTRYINLILKHRDSLVRLAVLSDDHDVALGWSISRGRILDYVYVHRDYRRHGIATALVPQQITIVTHVTKTAAATNKIRSPDIIFNPFA